MLFRKISTGLLLGRNFATISQEEKRTTFRQGHLEKGLAQNGSEGKIDSLVFYFFSFW